MAISKMIEANGSKGHHKFVLNVSEDRTDISNNKSFLSFAFKISPMQNGYDWYDWGSRISYTITIGTKKINEGTENEQEVPNTYSGTIPAYNGTSTVTLKSNNNIEIPHNSDGTKTINISFSVTDNTGVNYTCGNASASDTMALSDLHKAPDITLTEITSEENTQLTELDLATNIIVQYLSNKRFSIGTTTYDDATISNYSIYHNNVLIGTSSTNVVQVDFSNVSELQTTLSDGTYYVGLTVAVTDNKGGYSTRIFNYPVIKYTRPIIEATSTHIKRLTGNGTVLADNKALLNFVGTCYKGNDVIGNNNTPVVQYKIWNGTEPDFSNVTCTVSGNNVIVEDYELSNILYTKVYDYIIKINDTFTNSPTNPIIKQSNVSTGISVWTEYDDRVDFLKITTKETLIGKNVNINSNGIEHNSASNGSFNFNGSVLNLIDSNSNSMKISPDWLPKSVLSNWYSTSSVRLNNAKTHKLLIILAKPASSSAIASLIIPTNVLTTSNQQFQCADEVQYVSFNIKCDGDDILVTGAGRSSDGTIVSAWTVF